jgi:hypothetical protein
MHMRALAFGLLLASIQSTALAAEDLIQFIENANSVSPSRTLEFRFAEEMATAEDVLKGGPPSPVVIVPDIPGKWTWQSTRSGIFAPSQPWPLGTTVQIRVREEVKTLSGKELPDDWKRTLDMPSFAIQAWTNLSDHGESDQSAEPRFCILFNADVSAAAAEPSFAFVSGKQKILAKVESSNAKRPGLSWFRRWETNDRSLQTWVERFGNAGRPGSGKNQLFVTPAKPLPPGESWKLTVAAGIPEVDGRLRTLNSLEIPVGNVKAVRAQEHRGYEHPERRKEAAVHFQ